MLVATYPKGQERAASERLTQLWRTTKQEDVFVDWGFPYLVSGFISKPSFFDSSPEKATLDKVFNERGKKLHRRFTLGTCNAQDGSFIIINDTVPTDRLTHYLCASSAVPGIFKYIVDPPYVFIDGGTVNSLNLRGGVEMCREEFGDDVDIIADIIVTNPCTNK